MTKLWTLGLVNLGFLAVTLIIGLVAYRRTTNSAEDYFLGGRGARTLVLFMALFGTNVTPFVLLGIPGVAYHQGVAEFGRNAAIVGLGIPLTFYLIGYPAYLAARKIGAITPAELYRERLGSHAVGVVLFLAYLVYTLPYMVTAVLGAGIATSVLTGGAVSIAVGAALVLVITLIYTSLGGMRATMWTNVFQGSVFMLLILVMFGVVIYDFGGLAAATGAVAEVAPQLLVKGDVAAYAPGPWGSWGLAISLTVIGFPHILVRLFASKDAHTLKNVCRLYPLMLLLLWLPAVMIGVWGAAEFPGLIGRQSDQIFPLMVDRHLGPALQGVALAGVLAAVMSTLDAQGLTLSSMLTRDVLRRGSTKGAGNREIVLSRLFLIVLCCVVYGVVLWQPASIFDIAKFAFSGYVTLVPTLYLGLHWRRFTASGAIASILLANIVLIAGFAGVLPTFAGLLPVVYALVVAIVAGVVVSLATTPPDSAAITRVMAPIDRVFGGPDRQRS